MVLALLQSVAGSARISDLIPEPQTCGSRAVATGGVTSRPVTPTVVAFAQDIGFVECHKANEAIQ